MNNLAIHYFLKVLGLHTNVESVFEYESLEEGMNALNMYLSNKKYKVISFTNN